MGLLAFIQDQRGMRAMLRGEYDRSIAIYRKLCETDPCGSSALSMIAYCQERKGDMEAAMRTAEECLAQCPDDHEMLSLAIRYWRTKGDVESVYHFACRLVALPPKEWHQPPVPRIITAIPFFRRVVREARASLKSTHIRRQSEYEWALKFRESYEVSHGVQNDGTAH